MVKKQHLGRGLSALLGDDQDEKPTNKSGAQQVRIEFLHPGSFQPRQHFDEEKLSQLANSIASQGVLQPILVRPLASKKDEYEILAGERRWRAAQLARLHEVPVIIRDISDLQALEIAIIENIQRDDLNPIEEAQGYQRLIDQFHYTHDDLAHKLGKSRPHVTQLLRLLSLPDEVKAMLIQGQLTMGHARVLVTAKEPLSLARQVIDGNLSVRQAEELAREARSTPSSVTNKQKPERPLMPGKMPVEKDADTRALEKSLRQSLGLQVDLQFDGKGGSITIHYQNLDQLDDITKKLQS